MKIEQCPYCQGKKFIEAVSFWKIAVERGLRSRSCPLYYQICRDCGMVVASYVEDPKELLFPDQLPKEDT